MKMRKSNKANHNSKPAAPRQQKSSVFNKPKKTVEKPDEVIYPMRLNKFVAHCELGSRRKAAEMVKEGLISLNGEVHTNPATEVTATDVVTYNNQVLKPQTKRIYILMNKPKNTITTLNDEKGRKTVMEIIDKKIKERIYPVGRLDRETTGLLLLTNDGDLATKLSHPSYNIEKIYHVVLDIPLAREDYDAIIQGLQLEDGVATVDALHYKDNKLNELIIKIHIGRNRIVRRIFEHLNYQVTKLDRIYYAGLTKKNLKRGWFRELTEAEIIMLKHFVSK